MTEKTQLKAPSSWHCGTHGPGAPSSWGCPDCVAELRRWKSTHAPRLEALEGLLHAAQAEAAAGREAVASLASERAANAQLTDEVDALRWELDATKRAREATEAECTRLRAELAAERKACAAICRTQAARWADNRARYAAHECAAAIESAAPYRAGPNVEFRRLQPK